MDTDALEGRWDQFKGMVKERWGRLTDDDLKECEGRHEQLVGKLRQYYDMSEQEAEAQLAEMRQRLHEAHLGARTPPPQR